MAIVRENQAESYDPERILREFRAYSLSEEGINLDTKNIKKIIDMTRFSDDQLVKGSVRNPILSSVG